MFAGTKGVLKANKDCQKKKDKRTNNDLQNTTRIPLKLWGELKCSGAVCSSCATSDIRLATLKRQEHRLIWTFQRLHISIKYIKIKMLIYHLFGGFFSSSCS